jgi:hypothetical protein
VNPEKAAFWTPAGSKGWYYMTPSQRMDVHSGFIEKLGPNEYNASDISGHAWRWHKFTDLEEAKRWVEVCVRMNHAS